VIEATLFTDPVCPWAYSAHPAHRVLEWRYGDGLRWRLVMIGLHEDPERMRARGFSPLRSALGYTRFRRYGMPFAPAPKLRLAASARACRALVATRLLSPGAELRVYRALQLANFTTPVLLDEEAALARVLATVDGVDGDAVVARIDDPEVVAAYEADKAEARTAAGSPSELLGKTAQSDGPVRYTAPSVIFEHAGGHRIEVGGFQPFEAYDTALANLDVTLDRRPAPAEVREALAGFPDGLTTAEAAAVMRPSDLVDADRPATEGQLLALAGEGGATSDPVGGDAVWRLDG
jgi:2-hydroxychromene-2-carboxylate isomerase